MKTQGAPAICRPAGSALLVGVSVAERWNAWSVNAPVAVRVRLWSLWSQLRALQPPGTKASTAMTTATSGSGTE